MTRIIFCNAFSLSMLIDSIAVVGVKEVNIYELQRLIATARERGVEIDSAIGHPATAKVLSKILGLEIPVNRKMIKLDKDIILVVFQLLQRLPPKAELSEEELAKIPFKLFLVFLARPLRTENGYHEWIEPENSEVEKLLTEANIDLEL